jgi:enoyl-CoA hydratase/carnithine racemase
MIAAPTPAQPVLLREEQDAVCTLTKAARFSVPGVTWGFFCSTPGVAVGRNLQRKHAMEMLLTGDAIDARRALEWGLVNSVVPAEELDDAVRELTSKITEKPPEQVAEGKRTFYQQMDLGLVEAYDLAGHAISRAFANEEGRRGMDAFIEKRPPPKP